MQIAGRNEEQRYREVAMPEKKIYKGIVVSNQEIADGIMKMKLSAPEAAGEARPGQFANLYPAADSLILPRPISICDADGDDGTLTFVYAVVGAGTAEFAGYESGDTVRVSSPLGTGFLLPSPAGAESVPASGSLNAVLIGGGVGCAPMLFAAKELRSLGVSVTAVAGFRKEPFLIKELKDAGARVVVTTDMPTENAFLGTVVDCMEINEIRGDLYFSCGPRAMLSAVCSYLKRRGEDVQVSLEERMGCGYGACVGCVCDIKVKDAQGKETAVRKKVCKDGPVFLGSEVIW